MTPGVFIPVWREHRYLPLVLEQAALCPGPKILYFQDKPWYWTGEGSPPSGWDSGVKDLLQFAESMSVEVIRREKDSCEAETFWNCLRLLKERGADRFINMDSDWLYTFADMRRIYEIVRTEEGTHSFGTLMMTYWRDWTHAMGMPTKRLTCTWMEKQPPHGGWPEPETSFLIDVVCYHPAYVHTNEEIKEKVQGWEHAEYFRDRKFLEKEWFPGDDSLVKPYRCSAPPKEITDRLRRCGAL